MENVWNGRSPERIEFGPHPTWTTELLPGRLTWVAVPFKRAVMLAVGLSASGKRVRCEPGSFQMGNQSSTEGLDGPEFADTGEWDERPVHQVTVSRTFHVSETEVTIGQFRQFTSDRAPFFQPIPPITLNPSWGMSHSLSACRYDGNASRGGAWWCHT